MSKLLGIIRGWYRTFNSSYKGIFILDLSCYIFKNASSVKTVLFICLPSEQCLAHSKSLKKFLREQIT